MLNLVDDDKDAIERDLYFYALQFAFDNHFIPEQISTTFSIFKATHDEVKCTFVINYSFFSCGFQ